MTRDVIEGSRNKSFEDQKALLSRLCHEKHVAYEVPPILDAAICIFIEYVRSGTWLFSQSPWTYTLCQEKYDGDWQLLVGGFGPGGLGVNRSGEGNMCVGIGGLKKL
jgi:hypothetical protein